MSLEAKPVGTRTNGDSVGHLQAVHQLEATLNAVSEGITVQGPDGALMLANDAAPGRAPAGKSGAAGFGAARAPGAMAAGHTGENRFSLVTTRPVRDDNGTVLFAVNVFRDVTDRQRALDALRASEARLAFLASASRRLLTTALEPRRVLEQVADLVVPDLADWCFVRELADDGTLERVAVDHRDPTAGELVARLEGYGDLLGDDRALGELRAERSIRLDEVTDSMLRDVAADADHLELLRRLGVRSVLLVPLRTRGRTIGALTLVGGRERPPYGEPELALAEEVASRVAATVDHARAFAREHTTAETLTRVVPRTPTRDPRRRARRPLPCLRSRRRRLLRLLPHRRRQLDAGRRRCLRPGHPGRQHDRVHPPSIRAAALHASSPRAVLTDVNDGITERRHEGDLFHEHLPSTLRAAAGMPAPMLAGQVETAAVSFARTVPDDDMTVLVLAAPATDASIDPSRAAPTADRGVSSL